MNICVSIASYRDPKLTETLYSLFNCAKFPFRIFAYIHIQAKDTVDLIDWEKIYSKSSSMLSQADWKTLTIRHIKYYVTDYKLAGGPLFARQDLIDKYKANMMKQDYYLQIDSHMSFKKGWDETIFDCIFATQDPHNAILSHYPLSSEQDEKQEWRVPEMTIQKPYKKYPKIKIFEAKLFEGPDTPNHSIGLAAGCMFCSVAILSMYPMKRFHGLFQGEEYYLAKHFTSLKLDLYSFSKNFCSHEYNRKDTPLIWNDQKEFKHKEYVALKSLKKELEHYS